MDAVVAARPSRNPRFDRKRSRSRSPTVARSLSPPSSRRHHRRSPSPAERGLRHAKRQRVAPSASQEGGAPRPFGRVSVRGGAARHANTTNGNYNGNYNRRNNNRGNIDNRGNANRRNDASNNYHHHHHNNNKRYTNRVGDNNSRQRVTRPVVVVESWADASGSEDEDRDDDAVQHDMGDQEMCVDGEKQHRENDRDGGDDNATRRGAGRRQPNDVKGAERSPSPCLVPDSEDEYQHSDDDDDHDRHNSDRDGHPLDEHADDRDRDGSGDEEREEHRDDDDDDDEEEEEEEGESRPATDSNTTARKDDERTRALRTLASTTFDASGQAAYKRPKRPGRRGKGSAERRRLRMMQKRLGIDVTVPAPETAVHHIGGPTNYRRVDNRHAQRDNPEPADNAARHRQGRVEAGRHHPHHVATKEEETLRRQRISTIDAIKHIDAYHEACRRACIDRVPPPPPPPENMFALVRNAVDLFLAGRTSPRP
ncbi:Rho binding incomplete domain containing protein [Pandoravirus macleodensis]|uniref:Rho binding incomplete domain containing protein n=1 Tax=Pandoravirus macleodensis TaxID=2107707 RepID=A0A2U7UEG7_9VIRU|nr:Rho binding incomplete domain containing protein [Pandoravirus macleodensis]AVK76710.1 Rho binding incomplete domain containing protein [Pandoravirus macleodensis]